MTRAYEWPRQKTIPKLRAYEGIELFHGQRGVGKAQHQVGRYQQPDRAKHNYYDQVGKIGDMIGRLRANIEFCCRLKIVRARLVHSAILLGYCPASRHLLDGSHSVS